MLRRDVLGRLGGGFTLSLVTSLIAFSLPANAVTPTVERSHPVTQMVQLDPLNADGTVGSSWHQTGHYGDADCESGSPLTGVDYTCYTPQSKRAVYDPCWVEHDESFVACVPRPWKPDVVILDVTGGYDNATTTPEPREPWAMRIATGHHCIYDPSAVSTTHGRAVTDFCDAGYVIAGPIKKAGDHWQVRVYKHSGVVDGRDVYRSRGLQAVTKEWRGLPSATATATATES